MKEEVAQTLSVYRPFDEDEAQMFGAMLSFVVGEDRPWSRSVKNGHLTASVWIVNAGRSKALLVHHAKLQKWMQPGGHIEEEDLDLASAALREAREETGLVRLRLIDEALFDVDVHGIPPINDPHRHYDCRFLVEADETEGLVCSEESTMLRWVDFDEIKGLGMDSLMRMAKKASKI